MGGGDSGNASELNEVKQTALPVEDDLKGNRGNDSGNVPPPKKTTSNSVGVLKRMFSFVSPDGGKLASALVSLIVSSSSNLALPYLVGKVVDRALANGGSGNRRGISAKICTNNVNFFLGAAGVFACGAMASYIRTYNFNIISFHVGKRMRSMLFDHLLDLDMRFYDAQENGSGECIHVLSEDVGEASNIYTNYMSSALRSTSSAINGSIMLLTISPQLTLLSVGMVSIPLPPSIPLSILLISITVAFFALLMFIGSSYWCICHGFLKKNENIRQKDTEAGSIGNGLCK